MLRSPQCYDLLGIGITSNSLTDLERRILRDNTPYAVVLFGRNIGEAEEFRELTARDQIARAVRAAAVDDR